jgi:hypothetical protein
LGARTPPTTRGTAQGRKRGGSEFGLPRSEHQV